MVKVLLAVVAAVLVLGAAGTAYFLAGQAQANAAIRAVNADIDKVNASFDQIDAITKSQPAYPDFTQSSSPQAFVSQAQQFDTAAGQAQVQVTAVGDVVTRDRAAMRDAQRHLDTATGSWLTLPQRSRLDAGRRRAGYEQQALDVAASAVAVAGRQIRSAKDAIDGLAAYAGMVEKLQAGDYAGSLSAYGGVHNLLGEAGTDASGAHLPGVWNTLLADLNKLVDDTRDGVQAIQNGDSATAQAKANTLDADSKALDGLDTSSLHDDTYLQGLIDQIKALEAKAG